MTRACCVVKSHSRSHDHLGRPKGNGIGFYRIPAWKRNSSNHVSEVTKRRPNITYENTCRLMCLLFPGKPAYEMLECLPDWAPSLNLGHSEIKTTTTERFERLCSRSKAKQHPNTPPRSTGPDTEEENIPAENHTQGNRTSAGRKPKIEGGAVQKKLDEDFLKDNDPEVKFYTGLPSFALLMGVLMLIRPSLPNTERKLSHFQMLLLTFMRLRLNLPLDHIAHLFDISRTTTSNLFYDTVSVLFAHLSPLVLWPKRHYLQTSMPHQHVEMFGDRVAVIIDCFELCIERAQTLRAKAETYSNYKSRHTMKYLTGRASDKLIAETSGFLQSSHLETQFICLPASSASGPGPGDSQPGRFTEKDAAAVEREHYEYWNKTDKRTVKVPGVKSFLAGLAAVLAAVSGFILRLCPHVFPRSSSPCGAGRSFIPD
uniref:Transposase Helix-turn-helix domain-containing protein n=1 Tax=Acanthochromis polyacanthus TaxID=80966 RepID=A0A3Q1EF41_9TELE